MNKLIEEFLSSQGNDVASSISSKLGVDASQITKMLPDITSSVFGGVKDNLKNDNSAIDGVLGSLGSGDMMESIGGLMGGSDDSAESGSLINTILGGSKSGIISSLASKFNLGGDTITKIISMAIPLLMKFLSNKAGGQGLSGLTGLLDADGDGSIMDDVGGLLGGKGKDIGNTLKGLF